MRQLSPRGLSPVGVNGIDIGEDHQQLCIELSREYRRGGVLVDNRIYSFQSSMRIHVNRNPSSSARDHDRLALYELADDRQIVNRLRCRTSNNASVHAIRVDA